MFRDTEKPVENATSIVAALSDHGETMSHSRHISTADCIKMGLKIIRLEDERKDRDFQDCILSIHHSYMHAFANSNAVKIIENQHGVAMIQNAVTKAPVVQPLPIQVPNQATPPAIPTPMPEK